MFDIKKQFDENGFVLIKNALSLSQINLLSLEYDRLIEVANNIIKYTKDKNILLSDYYFSNKPQLIVVPESHEPSKICRLEYLAESSEAIKNNIVRKTKDIVDDIMGEPFVLFKDKCNLKSSGGGAFPPHQDMSAYYHFKPTFHVTAAIMLDNSNVQNGCLEMAADYKNNFVEGAAKIKNRFGEFPFFSFYKEGHNNGNIKEEISANFVWKPIEASSGDMILFNSFVPHQSKKNTSSTKRRNFFFTFNALSEGDHYEFYYATKRHGFNNPMFHVATPTKHT